MAIQINDLPEITINGEKMEDYVFTDMILNKELLKPNEFRFTMRKKDLSKTASDIAFELCDKLLGAKVECKVKTLRRNEEQEEVGEELAFTGLIFNANTQREIMGKGMVVNCVAYSPDYLLIDSPNYNFFEEKNLKEIIDEIVAEELSQDDSRRFRDCGRLQRSVGSGGHPQDGRGYPLHRPV